MIPFPNKQYDIIYADPAWPYKCANFTTGDKGETSKVTHHYNTMTWQDLADLPVSTLAKPDCTLYLWATGPLLHKQIRIGEAWGFDYKQTAFVWDKVRGVPGRYSYTQTEFLLVFRIGKMIPPSDLKGIHQLYREKKTRHSAKPSYFRDTLDHLYPKCEKIELFARSKTQGWDVWGNEV